MHHITYIIKSGFHVSAAVNNNDSSNYKLDVIIKSCSNTCMGVTRLILASAVIGTAGKQGLRVWFKPCNLHKLMSDWQMTDPESAKVMYLHVLAPVAQSLNCSDKQRESPFNWFRLCDSHRKAICQVSLILPCFANSRTGLLLTNNCCSENKGLHSLKNKNNKATFNYISGFICLLSCFSKVDHFNFPVCDPNL